METATLMRKQVLYIPKHNDYIIYHRMRFIDNNARHHAHLVGVISGNASICINPWTDTHTHQFLK